MLNKSDNHDRKRRCDNCGKAGVIEKRITRVYGRGQNALVIENVPVIVCPQCGVAFCFLSQLARSINATVGSRHGLNEGTCHTVLGFMGVTWRAAPFLRHPTLP